MNKVIRLIAAGALLAAGVPLSAMAQTITVNATVNSQCNIGNATVNFGALTLGAQTDNTASNITLTCNRGATVSVALNDGVNASVTQKRMRRPATTDYINYSITVPTISGVTTTCPALPGTSWNATNTLVASPAVQRQRWAARPALVCLGTVRSVRPRRRRLHRYGDRNS